MLWILGWGVGLGDRERREGRDPLLIVGGSLCPHICFFTFEPQGILVNWRANYFFCSWGTLVELPLDGRGALHQKEFKA